MAKVMVVLRSVFLLFILIYMFIELPILAMWSSDSSQIPKETVGRVASVAWAAIGWIALETALGWARVWLDRRKAAKAAAPAGTPAP